MFWLERFSRSPGCPSSEFIGIEFECASSPSSISLEYKTLARFLRVPERTEVEALSFWVAVSPVSNSSPCSLIFGLFMVNRRCRNVTLTSSGEDIFLGGADCPFCDDGSQWTNVAGL